MPIGNYFTARPFDNPSARTLEGDIANVIDAGVGAAAKARPYLKNFVQNLSKKRQEQLGSAMNMLPESVNLLGRYYTGLGDTNLSHSDTYKQDLGSKVKEAHRKAAFHRFQLGQAEQDQMRRIEDSEKFMKDIQAGQAPINLDNQPMTMEFARTMRKDANDALAFVRSRMNKMDEGYIPFESEAGTDTGNPLTSSGTSLGSAYFKPNPDGSYTTKETYDFVYADDDRKAREAGNFYGPVTAEEEYRMSERPSQGFARAAAEALLGRQQEFVGLGGKKFSTKDITGAAPITNIGRSLVSRLPDEPFDYSLTVRPK